jgi:hypothetical protein
MGGGKGEEKKRGKRGEEKKRGKKQNLGGKG